MFPEKNGSRPKHSEKDTVNENDPFGLSRKPRARPMAAAIAAPLSRISSRTERSTVGSGQYSPAESMLHHTSESAQGSK